MAEQRSRDENEIVLGGGAGGEKNGQGIARDKRLTRPRSRMNAVEPKKADHPGFGVWDSNDSDVSDSFTHIRDKEFGRDTSRLDYFSFTGFNLHGDDDLTTSTDYGGGGDQTRQRGLEVVPGPIEQDRGIPRGEPRVHGVVDRDRSRQSPANINGDVGGEVVAETPEVQGKYSGKKGNGGEDRGLGWWKKWCNCWH